MGDKETSALISQSEAARMLNVTRQRVNRMVKDGKVKTTNIAGIPFLYFEEIAELARNRENA